MGGGWRGREGRSKVDIIWLDIFSEQSLKRTGRITHIVLFMALPDPKLIYNFKGSFEESYNLSFKRITF